MSALSHRQTFSALVVSSVSMWMDATVACRCRTRGAQRRAVQAVKATIAEGVDGDDLAERLARIGAVLARLGDVRAANSAFKTARRCPSTR
ncbi:hypothetical protein [Streptosporangium sp. NPDC000396]|uniref:hypothetical protein n=1 Tax=Streptosporangium sp. NPDC000396 TaxID=3366185 RepID=UPI0036AF7406